MGQWERFAPYVIFIIRMVAAVLFLAHGAQKLWGFTGAPVEQSVLTQRGVADLQLPRKLKRGLGLREQLCATTAGTSG